jgi:hypothetical protein
MSAAPYEPIPPEHVYDFELRRIVKRRNRAFGSGTAENCDAVRGNLVGLASSGGGLRSATFNLGLIQALRRYGLLPFVDYQSSVSGGGYTAGYLSRVSHDVENFHAVPDQDVDLCGAVEGAIAPVDHLRFRDCGNYLRRPVEFLAEYVFCTSLVLTLFVSGLLAIALTIAIIWRTLDFNVVRDHLGVIDLNIELFIAFLPCLALLLLWIVLATTERFEGLVRRWTASMDQLRRTIYRSLILVAIWAMFAFLSWLIQQNHVSFILIPLAAFLDLVMLSIGTAGLVSVIARALRRLEDPAQTWFRTYLGPLLLGAVGLLSAIPFLSKYFPDSLVERISPITFDTTKTSFTLHENAFVLTVFGLTLAAFLAAWAAYGTSQFTRKVFLAFLISPAVAVMVLIANGSLSIGWLTQVSGLGGELTSQRMLREPLVAFVVLCVLVLFRYRRLLQSARPDANFWERVAFGIVVSGIVVGVPMVLIGWVGREGISGYATYRDPDLLESDIQDWPGYLDLWNDKGIGPPGQVAEDFRFGVKQQAKSEDALRDVLSWNRNRYTIFNPDYGFISRAGMLMQSWMPGAHATNRVPGYLAALLNQRRDRERFCRIANKRNSEWLASPNLTRQLVEQIRLRSLQNPSGADNELNACINELETQPEKFVERDRLMSFVERATDHLAETSTESADQKKKIDFDFQVAGPYWTDRNSFNLKSFNRLLLESLYPRIFKSRVLVSTPIVVAQDQISRVGYLALSSGIFLALFFSMPINRLSPFHNFYRRMLETRFFSPVMPENESKLMLAKLRSHWNGGPYPLFMGSLFFVDEQPSDTYQATEHLLRSRSVALMMSPAYCGTREFGFQPTRRSHWKEFSVGDAVAISGAALSPLAFSTGPIYWILTAFNLRTGQWIARSQDAGGRQGCLSYVKPYQVYREFFAGNRANSSQSKGGAAEESEATFQEQNRGVTWGAGSTADGGYCDFLGIEPLLDRRCRLIIASDAGCNQGTEEFRSLGDLMRKVRLEQGIEILDWDDDRPLDISRLQRDEKTRLSPQHFVMGRIIYPPRQASSGSDEPSSTDGSPREGVLVYVQMTLNGDEGADLAQYHRSHATFPDEPTPNQFFDPSQVEVFRSLGYHTGKTLCFELGERLARIDLAASKIDGTEFLIQRLSDMYALAGSAELKVDENDFRSRLPFFPELAETLGDAFRDCMACLDHRATTQRAEVEAVHLKRFERSADCRRQVFIEIESVVNRRHNDVHVPHS